jgi:hypothetical protein
MHPAIENARRVATLLDSAFTIPGVRWKIGLDPLLGLLPGSGDVVAGLLSLYVLGVAWHLRLPRHVIVRMGVNTLLDVLLGLLPLVGDVADFFWKSNRRNIRILEAAYQQYGPGADAPVPDSVPPAEVTIDVEAVDVGLVPSHAGKA